jgi:hypothetical protein
MPLLSKEYIPSLYYFSFYGGNILLDKFSESEVQDVKPQKLIQGDIGTHVLNVGGTKWKSILSSPIFTDYLGAIYLLDKALNDDNFMLSLPTSLVNTVLQEAGLTITPEGVTCNLTCLSDTGSITNWLIPQLVSNPSNSFAGRTARFYDINLEIPLWNMYNYSNYPFLINSASVTVAVNISEKFYIKKSINSPYPEFSIQGYTISGKFDLTYPFIENVSFFPLEKFQNIIQGSGFILSVGSITLLDLSKGKMVISNLTKSVDSGKNTSNIGFEFVCSSAR